MRNFLTQLPSFHFLFRQLLMYYCSTQDYKYFMVKLYSYFQITTLNDTRMHSILDHISIKNLIFIILISIFVIFLHIFVICLYCDRINRVIKRKSNRRSKSRRRHGDASFTDIPLNARAIPDKTLTAFLASAREQVVNEKSTVKHGLLEFAAEQFDEPALYPRSVSSIGRKTDGNLNSSITNFNAVSYEHRPQEESLQDRRYKTVNASFKYNQENEDITYANLAIIENLKKKDSFGSEQMIVSKKSIEEPPPLLHRATIQKSSDSFGQEIDENKVTKKKPYEHLHISDEKKKKHQYENHEIITRNRSFVIQQQPMTQMTSFSAV